MSIFHTIKNPCEGFFKDKGSKFIAKANPISDLESFEKALSGLKSEYADARHHCYAYVIGLSEQSFRVNDDGEPSHTAGDPILGQIRAFDLTNVLVVVIRYFGGVKLGVGGLVNAYRTAAKEALSNAKIIPLYPKLSFSLSFPYELTGEMESLFNGFNLEFTSKVFEQKCQFTGKVREEEAELFDKRLSQIYKITYSIDR